MITRSVENRVCVDFSSFDLPLSSTQALDILAKQHIRPIEVDIVTLAKSLVDRAKWRWGARQWEAPHYFDCSSLTKWLFGQKGIWLPRRSAQQLEFCHSQGLLQEEAGLQGGDLLFVNSSYRQGVKTDSDDSVHVCLASSSDQVISATKSELGQGLIEVSLSTLKQTRKILSVGRVIPADSSLTTLMFPPSREVETADDIRCILQQSL